MEKIVVKNSLIKTINEMVDYIENYKNFPYKQLLVRVPKDGLPEFNDMGYDCHTTYVEGYKDHSWVLDTFIASPERDFQSVIIVCDATDIDLYFQVKGHGILSLSGKTQGEVIQTIQDLSWFD